MKKLIVLVFAMLISFPVFANGSSENLSGNDELLKVALILPGRRDDVSFNQAMYEGVMNYYETHSDEIELQIVENVYDVADIEPALIDFASEGYDVIFGHGFQFMEPIIAVAPRYPETAFLLGTGYKYVSNSAIYDIALEYGGYLMGVIAAKATNTNMVGLIGGAEASEMVRGHAGFKAGVASVDASIQIQEVYTGDWNDTAGAYEAAVGMYDAGVDVIWHSGDGIGLGVVQAARDRDKYVLGNVEDQLALAPDNVLSGVQYNWIAIIEKMFDDIESGAFFSLPNDKRIYWITIPNEGIIYTEINDPKGMLSEADKDEIEHVFQQIKSGEIDLTYLASIAESVD